MKNCPNKKILSSAKKKKSIAKSGHPLEGYSLVVGLRSVLKTRTYVLTLIYV